MLNFQFSYKINDSIISPSELKSLYLFGIKIEERNGTEMNDNIINTFIKSAQRQVENYLNLKLEKQIIEERLPFYRDIFEFYNYIQTSYPARKGYRLQGWVANVKQVEYPIQWLTTRTTSDNETYHRRVHLIPVGSTEGQTLTFNGLMPYVGMRGQSFIPDYWKIAYSTGFDKIPEEIITVIGKIASIFILQQMGDVILGPGISSMSLGLDGLSQSVSSTKSASNSAFGARISVYLKDIERELKQLKDKFTGFIFAAL
jgi:hypothetical protein